MIQVYYNLDIKYSCYFYDFQIELLLFRYKYLGLLTVYKKSTFKN